MTKATIQAIADEVGGAQNIIGLRMANGTKFYFSRYRLSMDDFVTMADTEIIKFRHKDTMGREAVSYMVVEEIVWVYTIADIEAGIILRDILD